jgi:hypothetical protein
VAGGRVASVLGPLSVGVLPVGGFIFLFFPLVFGWFVRFSLWGRGGRWGAGYFLRARADFFGVYTPYPCSSTPFHTLYFQYQFLLSEHRLKIVIITTTVGKKNFTHFVIRIKRKYNFGAIFRF